MDWNGAIERQREELLRIVAALFAMAGLIGLRSVETLPRHIHRRILLVLRPAESAVRRLIVATARDTLFVPSARQPNILSPEEKAAIIEQARLSRQRGREMQAREAYGPIHRQINLGLAGVPAPGWKPPSAPGARQQAERSLRAGQTTPAFPLFDPLKRFDIAPRRRRARGIPRIVNFFDGDPQPVAARPQPARGDTVDARRLCRRMRALRHALDDLPGQAKRLARWQARRDRMLVSSQAPGSNPGRTREPRRSSPMRPGWPPGHRKRPVHAIDEVLRECHWLAWEASKARAPDTS